MLRKPSVKIAVSAKLEERPAFAGLLALGQLWASHLAVLPGLRGAGIPTVFIVGGAVYVLLILGLFTGALDPGLKQGAGATTADIFKFDSHVGVVGGYGYRCNHRVVHTHNITDDGFTVNGNLTDSEIERTEN